MSRIEELFTRLPHSNGGACETFVESYEVWYFWVCTMDYYMLKNKYVATSIHLPSSSYLSHIPIYLSTIIYLSSISCILRNETSCLSVLSGLRVGSFWSLLLWDMAAVWLYDCIMTQVNDYSIMVHTNACVLSNYRGFTWFLLVNTLQKNN